ncbi:helix-turn-helix domain-containing protein [Aestuariivirga sp. YIM B02566]|uniref:Helix-turn-helix domain-containing protein n=1 Tax=Taklimakanibacter albus TaxID=2800327 RepID=A0ACC5RFU3_9HYPH|nr:helix-turn-helix domain-containing protein [Aestuariivirga sp. YIM B02566]MBK1871458.1 helix-turn-helix domain-containing protein [Aestuariivirga sp. YIM B02566]
MNIHHVPTGDRLRQRLVARLKSFEAPAASGVHTHAHNLFSYCALERERLAAIKLPHPLIGIVLRGRKEVWLGDAGRTFGPGSVIILPRNIPMDVVNIPGETGIYESLILEVPMLPEGVPPLTLAERLERETISPTFSVTLTEDLVEALSHAATTIRAEAMSEEVKTLRLREVLTLLRPLPEARALFTAPLGDEVAWLIASAPSEDWTVERVAKATGLGASTLRRRLTQEGRPFRAILRAERLRAGRAALAAGASSLSAAEAAGYVSRSHFARRYRESFGTSPSGRKAV